MPQGAFNVSRLIAELGLKPVDRNVLRVLESIQPTMVVGDLSDVTPPHVAPSAFFGGLLIGGVGTSGALQIQSLAQGGSFVEWLTFDSANTTATFSIQTTDPGLPTILAGFQASRDPIVGIARRGDIAVVTVDAPVISQDAAIISFAPRPIFVPRGQFFLIQLGGTTATSNALFGIGWREVPASEHVPS